MDATNDTRDRRLKLRRDEDVASDHEPRLCQLAATSWSISRAGEAGAVSDIPSDRAPVLRGTDAGEPIGIPPFTFDPEKLAKLRKAHRQYLRGTWVNGTWLGDFLRLDEPDEPTPPPPASPGGAAPRPLVLVPEPDTGALDIGDMVPSEWSAFGALKVYPGFAPLAAYFQRLSPTNAEGYWRGYSANLVPILAPFFSRPPSVVARLLRPHEPPRDPRMMALRLICEAAIQGVYTAAPGASGPPGWVGTDPDPRLAGLTFWIDPTFVQPGATHGATEAGDPFRGLRLGRSPRPLVPVRWRDAADPNDTGTPFAVQTIVSAWVDGAWRQIAGAPAGRLGRPDAIDLAQVLCWRLFRQRPDQPACVAVSSPEDILCMLLRGPLSGGPKDLDTEFMSWTKAAGSTPTWEGLGARAPAAGPTIALGDRFDAGTIVSISYDGDWHDVMGTAPGLVGHDLAVDTASRELGRLLLQRPREAARAKVTDDAGTLCMVWKGPLSGARRGMERESSTGWFPAGTIPSWAFASGAGGPDAGALGGPDEYGAMTGGPPRMLALGPNGALVTFIFYVWGFDYRPETPRGARAWHRAAASLAQSVDGGTRPNDLWVVDAIAKGLLESLDDGPDDPGPVGYVIAYPYDAAGPLDGHLRWKRFRGTNGRWVIARGDFLGKHRFDWNFGATSGPASPRDADTGRWQETMSQSAAVHARPTYPNSRGPARELAALERYDEAGDPFRGLKRS